ncbi:MAG: hypothetical protein IKI31_06935, partial [Treponema sp.]|nr:hypothetical protein [Treponema sp.]
LAIVGLVLYAFFARKEFKTFLLNIDIIFNLSFISVLYVVAHKLNPSGVQLALEILLILNTLLAFVFLFYFKKNESSVYFIPSIIYYFIKLSYSSNQNATANFFLIVSLISIFIHSYALIKNNKSLKNISAIITGIVLFYETSKRYLKEGDFNSIEFSFFTLAFLIIVGLAVIYNLIKLIRNKLLFNPAIFLTPLLVILLTKIQDKFSILLTFPIVLLFCVYYFYLAYKDDSLKLANLSTIYFGFTLMVRFFSSGYGLAIQGLTFIAMGILLLVTNLLISKKRGLK